MVSTYSYLSINLLKKVFGELLRKYKNKNQISSVNFMYFLYFQLDRLDYKILMISRLV